MTAPLLNPNTAHSVSVSCAALTGQDTELNFKMEYSNLVNRDAEVLRRRPRTSAQIAATGRFPCDFGAVFPSPVVGLSSRAFAAEKESRFLISRLIVGFVVRACAALRYGSTLRVAVNQWVGSVIRGDSYLGLADVAKSAFSK